MVDSDGLAATHCQKIVSRGGPRATRPAVIKICINDGSRSGHIFMRPSQWGPSARDSNGQQGGVMSYVQPIQSSTEFKTKDVDVYENIRTLANSGAVFRMGDSSINDPTASNLS